MRYFCANLYLLKNLWESLTVQIMQKCTYTTDCTLVNLKPNLIIKTTSAANITKNRSKVRQFAQGRLMLLAGSNLSSHPILSGQRCSSDQIREAYEGFSERRIRRLTSSLVGVSHGG